MSDDNTETKDLQHPESPLPEKSSDNGEKIHAASSSDSKPSIGSLRSTSIETKSKIDVLLKPAGDAPIMKKKKWAVERSKKISWICEFLKKYLKFDGQDSMFIYVNQSFAPSPDTEIGTVFDTHHPSDECVIDIILIMSCGINILCFGSDGKLVLHYCRSQAWG